MSFDLTHYQPQLRDHGSSGRPKHVYQTIFLNATDAASWTLSAINPHKVLLRKWWRQFAHTWRHFAFVVPFMRFLQGGRGAAASLSSVDQQGLARSGSVYFCGSYTLFNTHEIAVISGLAAAHRLGAAYPFTEDALAAQQFDTYLKVAHGVDMQGNSVPSRNQLYIAGLVLLVLLVLVLRWLL